MDTEWECDEPAPVFDPTVATTVMSLQPVVLEYGTEGVPAETYSALNAVVGLPPEASAQYFNEADVALITSTSSTLPAPCGMCEAVVEVMAWVCAASVPEVPETEWVCADSVPVGVVTSLMNDEVENILMVAVKPVVEILAILIIPSVPSLIWQKTLGVEAKVTGKVTA